MPSPSRPVHIVAVDTETLALGAGRDRIVEFSVRELDENLETKSEWTQLVNPGRHIPAAATSIHGITDAMVQDEPTFAEVAAPLRALFTPRSVFMAYNASFDLGILDAEFRRCGQPSLRGIPVLDPLQVERRVLSRSLGPTYRRYTGRDLAGAHRAAADVEAMVEVLRHQRRVHRDKLPPSLLGLVDSLRPVPRRTHFWKDSDGTVRIGFGKHKGRAASEVPEYLDWMLRQDFPEPAKRVAQALLEA
jgi:DNA polymerase III subunit epsilon